MVYQYYQGHTSPGHSLVYELTQFLAKHDHEVTVVSGETGYMRRETITRPWYKRLMRWEQDGGVRVMRMYTYSELHKSYFGRLLSFLSFSLTCPLGLLSMSRPDVVIASSPPIFPMFSVWLVCKLRSIPLVLEVRDIWPESAVQMGVLRNRQLIGVMSWIERVLYDKSKRIVALTQGIQKNIRDRGWPHDKVELVTCGVNFDLLYPDEALRQETRQRMGWEARNVVMYFGALGEANNIAVILRAAQSLQSDPNMLFVIVGGGMMSRSLKEMASAMELTNVLFLEPVPKSEANAYLNAADICVATLQDIPLFQGAIPTKLLDYMACAKPVICGIRGEAQRIMEMAEAGLVFDPDDDQAMVQHIVELCDDRLRASKMGVSALDYVRQFYSAETSQRKMETILYDVVQESKRSSV
ncbi:MULTISPECIES: glycosyltransferase family 4 protein [unclassified Pseudomonas]|uniref:glycosyltransferase family 4 protein n=1 Tax=unclassified Pseudomonas TaxID=196821 RepID=UPI0015AF2096|nr:MULTISPECIES: glycosyltransferase family 4 protein [unclassified Pseudomonas]MCU1737660.1 glycosyltransferase family 4 protein [Pseudomonas sp. 20S_6.2_Bac1]